MIQLRVTVDTAAFRLQAQAKFADVRSALDDAVLYLARSARTRLAQATAEAFDRPTPFAVNAFSARLRKGTTMKPAVRARGRYRGRRSFASWTCSCLPSSRGSWAHPRASQASGGVVSMVWDGARCTDAIGIATNRRNRRGVRSQVEDRIVMEWPLGWARAVVA